MVFVSSSRPASTFKVGWRATTLADRCLRVGADCRRGARLDFVDEPGRSSERRSVEQHEPACQSAPTLLTCGLPSAFRVVNQNAERFGDRGSSCVISSPSCVATRDHSIAGSPSDSPRSVVLMVLRLTPTQNSSRPRERRTLRRRGHRRASGVSGQRYRGRGRRQRALPARNKTGARVTTRNSSADGL